MEVLLFAFRTTNRPDLLGALSRLGSCTGSLQAGRTLPASVNCVTAFAPK